MQGWKEYAREWYVVLNRSDYGIGDLVMTRPDGQYVVIEFKYIGWDTLDKTQKRQTVRQQAAYYANVLQLHLPHVSHKKIRCATVTDYYSIPLKNEDYGSKLLREMGKRFEERLRELKEYLRMT